MNATIKVLGQTDGVAPGELARYFVLNANANYYTDGGDKSGQWAGSAAKSLGLSGIVNEMPFTNVLSGRSPAGDKQLVQIQQQKGEGTKCKRRRDRAPGFDLTFSLPKSVSVLYAIGSPQVRLAIDMAMDRAAQKIINYLENSLPLGRRGKGGSIQEPAKLIVGMFDHPVNRNMEPQRHRHCVIANACQLEDGSWRTLNSPLLHKYTRTLGPMFRSEFAAELVQSLGVRLELPTDTQGKHKTAFEVVGVPQTLCNRWSSRRAEIEAMIAGDENGSGAKSAAARQDAALKTRQSKQQTPPLIELHAKWQAEAREFGFGPQEINQLCHQVEPVAHKQAYREARKAALATLTEQESDFSERQFTQKLFEEIQHRGVPMDFVLGRIEKDLAHSRDIVRLNSRDNELRFTTREMWRLEGTMLQDAKRLQARPGAQVSPEVVKIVLAGRPTIAGEQAKAVKDLLSDKSALRILAGDAGTGKSYTLDAVRDVLESAGYHVLGAALAGVAAEELTAKANIPSRTVASYLWHFGEPVEFSNDRRLDPIGPPDHGNSSNLPRPQRLPFPFDRRTVLIVDEFGMLPTKAAAAIFRHAVKAGVTVIATGDAAQIQPIEAGAPFKSLMRSRPRHCASLQINQRQQSPDDRQAVKDLRAGRAKAALENYRSRDRLELGKNQADTVRRLVKSWVKHGGCERPEKHLVFTHTRAETRVINRLCQHQRQLAGFVDSLNQVKIGRQSFGKGDRVLFHAPISDHGILNGYSGVVLRTNRQKRTITIRLDNRVARRESVVTIPLSRLKSSNISHSYSRTTVKGQGQTAENAYLYLGGPMTDRESAYTQATRGKMTTRLFADRLHAGEDLKVLAKAMEKSKAKGLAHDLGLRLEIEERQNK